MIKKWLKSKNQSWRGPLLTILAGFILSAIAGLTGYQLPLATAIFLLIIIYAAFTGSLLSSLISVLLAIGFTLTTLMPGGLLSFGERDLERLAVLSLGASLIALLIANFKQRTDQAITLKLKQQQQQLQAVLDNSTANIYLKDRQGHYLLINRQIERLFGLKNEEVVGKTDQELFPQNYVQQWNTNDRQVLATANPVEIEEDALQADGLHTYISVKFPLVDEHGEVYALGGISTDITELKQASQLLEQRVAERTAELTTLLKISRNVVGTLDLKSIAKLLLIQLSQLLKYDVALLSIYENDRFRLVDALVNSQRPSLESLAPLVASSPRLNEMLKLKKPLIIEDLAVNNSRLKQVGEQANVDLNYFHAALIIPLSVKEQVVGMLVITHRTVGYFTPHYAQLAQTIANQIAIAIENARLYEQAHKLAALEERQRLARELHDSTSQVLYSIQLGSRATHNFLKQSQIEQANESLDYVISLAKGGLDEMRSLIFELRPESLAREGLLGALQKQVSSLQARHGLEVVTQLGAEEEPDLPLEYKEAFYRIAREALHNVVKHAGNTRVELTLNWDEREIQLLVRDYGNGFNPENHYPDHFGLSSMTERVKHLNGNISIVSSPGNGTIVQVIIPMPNYTEPQPT